MLPALGYGRNGLTAVAKLIARADPKEDIVLRNRKGRGVVFGGRPIFLRVSSELPVIGASLTPHNLIMNHAASG